MGKGGVTAVRPGVPGDGFGKSVSMSSDGNLLAISAVKGECDGEPKCATGYVELYRFDSSNPPHRPFTLIPKRKNLKYGNIVQESERERDGNIFGLHVILSGDGSIICISGFDIEENSGFVKVYNVTELFYSHCIVDIARWIGNGKCKDYEPYYSAACGYDGLDCEPPKIAENYTECLVHDPNLINDGTCYDKLPYNTEKCGFDGGDCSNSSRVEGYPDCLVSTPKKIGDGKCDDLPYNSLECGFDGGDCLTIKFEPTTAPSERPTTELTLSQSPSASMNPSARGVLVRLELRTDLFPEETSWTLVDIAGQVVESGGLNTDNLYVEQTLYILDEWRLKTCLPYTFTITDLYDDGVEDGYPQGYFRIFVNGKRIMGTSDGTNFGSKDSIIIYYC